MTHPTTRLTVVTGARGFAGSHLLDRLAGRGPLVAWHRPGTPAPSAPRGVTWQAIDLLDRPAVCQAIAAARPARVYHVAGAPRVDTAWDNVVPHLETNVLGTHHLIDAVRQAGEPCRVLVVTSAMVYRLGEGPLDENAPLLPSSPYGLSKLAQDALALGAASRDGLDIVLARPFNHIGPRQDPSFAVSSFARQVAMIEAGRCEPVIRAGNLDARRDLTDVRDVAGVYEQLMDSAPPARAYNICSGRAVRIGGVLNMLIGFSRRAVSVELDEQRLRPSDLPLLLGNPARIAAEIGWTPRYTLDETLRDTLDWWRGKVRDEVLRAD